MPEEECVGEQIEESVELAADVEINCLIAAAVVFQSIFWAIPLNAPLEANKDKKCCAKK